MKLYIYRHKIYVLEKNIAYLHLFIHLVKFEITFPSYIQPNMRNVHLVNILTYIFSR